MLANKLKKWSEFKESVSKHLKVVEDTPTTPKNEEETSIVGSEAVEENNSASLEMKFPLEQEISYQTLLNIWQDISEDENHPLNGLSEKVIRDIKDMDQETYDQVDVRQYLAKVFLPVMSVEHWTKEFFYLAEPFNLKERFLSKLAEDVCQDQETSLEPLISANELNRELAIRALNLYLVQTDSQIKLPEQDLIIKLTHPQNPTLYFKVDLDCSLLSLSLNKQDVPSEKELLKASTDRSIALDIALRISGRVDGLMIVYLKEHTKETTIKLSKDLLDQKELLYTQKGFRSLLSYIDTYFEWGLETNGLISRERDKIRFDYLDADLNWNMTYLDEPSLKDIELEQHNHGEQTVFEVSLSKLKKEASTTSTILKETMDSNFIVVKLSIRSQLEGYLIVKGCLKDLDQDISKEPILETIALQLYLENEIFKNSIQNVILDKFTAIHPSVEWKFKQAALNYVEQMGSNEMAELDPIVFKNVFPLYGASDIRGSSSIRNGAIQSDLQNQLSVAGKIVEKLIERNPIPVFKELRYRIKQQIESLEKGLMAGDELAILDFLSKDVEPIFSTLNSDSQSIKSFIEEYRSLINEDHGAFYIERKKFDDSVTLLNEAITAYYDEEQEGFQKVFPHYFEKQATDGVDHTIYIGSSLVNEQEFHPIYLENMRLWQLMVICGAAFVAERLKSSLSVPLELTHLIAVQANPLSIRFNPDEKKFEVDGNYNIRYEIMKKRVDKACLKGSKERLTQPGKLAIVYSHRQEKASYTKYIQFLKAEGYLLDDMEELELEDLQGIQGLRALRVSINFTHTAPNAKNENKSLDCVLDKSKKWLNKKRDHVEHAAQKLNDVASELSEKVGSSKFNS